MQSIIRAYWAVLDWNYSWWLTDIFRVPGWFFSSVILNCNMKVDVNWTFCNRIISLASYFPSYLRPYTLSRIYTVCTFYHWIFLCDDFIVFEFLAVNSWKHQLIQIGGRLPNLFPLKPVKASLPYISACSDTSRQRLVIPN